jgi:hypothetical protein
MGWKASLITIRSPSVAKVDDGWLLEKLGYSEVQYAGEVGLEEVVNPGDNSVSIGEWNGNLIICDDHVLTGRADITATPGELLEYEAILTAIFRGSEVLSVACHSVVNYHLYALALDGRRLRYKQISGDTPRKEFGARVGEEELIYARSKMMGRELLFTEIEGEDAYEYTEDQLMEEFAFGVAARHLGFRIDEGDELFDVKLRKYTGRVPEDTSRGQKDAGRIQKQQQRGPRTVNEMLAGQTGGTDEQEDAGPSETDGRGIWARLKWWFGKW